MPIGWTTFKNNVGTYFRSMVAQNEQDAANFVAIQYTTAVLSGGDSIYGNSVIVNPSMKQTLATAIGNAFLQGATTINEGIVPSIFGSIISQGLIGYWSGAQLSPLIPPPGSTLVVSNVVSFPGSIIPSLSVSATENENEFIDNLVNFFIQHLQGISGITTALVSTPSGPVPTPFPWQSYG